MKKLSAFLLLAALGLGLLLRTVRQDRVDV